ncbi:MAG: FCD domain-containing protein [Oscillospiraceae bacterium]
MDRTLCALFALNDGTMENLLELRGILESQAFRDIAAYATDEEIESIAEKADYNYLDPSLERQNSNDHGFHLAMIQLSRNTLVKYLYTTLSALTKVYRGRVLAATLSLDEGYITQRDHQRIVNCLKNRDADGAVKALKEHLAITPKYMEIMPDAPENAVK